MKTFVNTSALKRKKKAFTNSAEPVSAQPKTIQKALPLVNKDLVFYKQDISKMDKDIPVSSKVPLQAFNLHKLKNKPPFQAKVQSLQAVFLLWMHAFISYRQLLQPRSCKDQAASLDSPPSVLFMKQSYNRKRLEQWYFNSREHRIKFSM